jgi:hypothetical protein
MAFAAPLRGIRFGGALSASRHDLDLNAVSRESGRRKTIFVEGPAWGASASVSADAPLPFAPRFYASLEVQRSWYSTGPCVTDAPAVCGDVRATAIYAGLAYRLSRWTVVHGSSDRTLLRTRHVRAGTTIELSRERGSQLGRSRIASSAGIPSRIRVAACSASMNGNSGCMTSGPIASRGFGCGRRRHSRFSGNGIHPTSRQSDEAAATAEEKPPGVPVEDERAPVTVGIQTLVVEDCTFALARRARGQYSALFAEYCALGPR